MRHIMIGLAALFVLSAAAAFGGELPRETSERIQQADQRMEKLSASKVGEYAREQMDAAKVSLMMAQGAGVSGNEKLALQQIERAELQLTVAEAKAGEKELSEDVALNRAELKKLEAQLERYMQPEEK
ncbi:MAG: hypothetical protein A2075_14080 [Geobacteraceae bacterium GWC2_58_44]|nr:MAG: hypothetical protein A2075_14080 [Geobacteraceae bacterium GWC2_58_44]HBG04298.1 hypothetical protein [Geobacter sp.]